MAATASESSKSSAAGMDGGVAMDRLHVVSVTFVDPGDGVSVVLNPPTVYFSIAWSTPPV